MARNPNITPEIRELVCGRVLSNGPDHLSIADASRKFNINRTTIAYWLDQKRKLPSRNSFKEIEPAPLVYCGAKPLGARNALELYLTCKTLGMDSTEAGLIGRKHGVKLAELKLFGQWYERYYTDDLVCQAPSLNQALNQSQNELVKARNESDSLGKELRKRDDTIVSLSMELTLSKKAPATSVQ